jgi:hypothetical protein
VISVYNLDLSLLQQILSECYGGRYSAGGKFETIRYFATLQETGPNGEMVNRDPNSSLIIITDKTLLYLRIDREGPTQGKPHDIFKTKLKKIKNVDVF